MVEAPVLKGATARGESAAQSIGASGPPLRLLAFVPKPGGMSPGQRFRLEQWAPFLASRHGITIDFVPFESPGLTDILYESGHTLQKAGWVGYDFTRRVAALLKARRYDGAIVYREAALIGGAIYERLLRWLDIPLFFDFDDAIWREVGTANGIFSRLHFWGKTSVNCRIASAVTVGNEYLASYARERNKNVFVLPTSIDLEKYPVQPELDQEEPFVICWTGSTTTRINLEHARTALERFAALRRTVVKVICNQPLQRPIANAETLFVPWSDRGEAKEIGASHVGIMPLQNDDYMRGKCGLKALQYMATGRPVVLSPVGMNADLVQNGQNGFLADGPEEWVEALTGLADSRELRQRVGAAGRKTVEESYSGAVVAERFAQAVRTTLANSGRLAG